MTKRHACAVRNLLGFALAVSIIALAGTASADPTGRIYIKTTNALGKNLATFSVDPNGNLFTASGATYFTGVGGLPIGGFIIKNAGTPLYVISGTSQPGFDPAEFGWLSIRDNNIGDQLPNPTGTGNLVFKSNGTPRLEFATQANGGFIGISQSYYTGFGFRKNAGSLSPLEIQNFRDAFLSLGTPRYPGTACETRSTDPWVDPGSGQVVVPNIFANLPGGVTYFSKFDETHSDTMTHGGIDFLPWHRELIGRIETLMRAYDPLVSLPYWDWSFTPAWLWTPSFMGVWDGYPCVQDNGQVFDAFTGDPNCVAQGTGPIDINPADSTSWSAHGFYDPSCDPTCADSLVDICTHACGTNPCRGGVGGGDAMMNPYYNAGFPVQTITRNAPRGDGQGVWAVATACGVASDDALVHFGDALQQDQQFVNFFSTLVCVHSYAHDYVGGTINPSQTSARDPFFYMMHANVDRLWASWQSHASYRLDTASAGLQTGIYGVGLISPYSEQMENLTFHFEPWADEQASAGMPMYRHIRPYTTHCNPSCPAGEGPEPAKDSTAVDIVTPPLYDSLLP